MQLRLALGGLFAARYRTGSGSQCIIMRLVAHCHLLTNKKTAALFDFDKLGSDTGKSGHRQNLTSRESLSFYWGFFLSGIYAMATGAKRVVRCVLTQYFLCSICVVNDCNC